MSDTETKAQPTPGPLKVKGLSVIREDPLRTAQYWVLAEFSAVAPQYPHAEGHEPDLGMGPETAKQNAKLYAAAGTAANDLPDEYDSVGAVEVLPELVDIAHRIIADSRLGDAEAGKPDPKPPARALLIELRKTLEQARTD